MHPGAGALAEVVDQPLQVFGSELDKPDGLTVLTEADVPTRIWPLPVRRINGIGPKAGAKLAAMGIATIGQLAATDRAALVAAFGRSTGRWLFEAAHGRDDRPLETHAEPVSMSRETTFERDLHAVRDRAELTALLDELVRRVATDLQRKGYAGRTVGIKLRFEDFRTVTRDLTLDAPTDDAGAIRHAAGLCLKRVDLTQRLRLLGVRAGSLTREPGPARSASPRKPRGGVVGPSDAAPSLFDDDPGADG